MSGELYTSLKLELLLLPDGWPDAIRLGDVDFYRVTPPVYAWLMRAGFELEHADPAQATEFVRLMAPVWEYVDRKFATGDLSYSIARAEPGLPPPPRWADESKAVPPPIAEDRVYATIGPRMASGASGAEIVRRTANLAAPAASPRTTKARSRRSPWGPADPGTPGGLFADHSGANENS